MSFNKTNKATNFYSGQRVDVADMQTNLLQYLIDTSRHIQIKCLGDGVISGLTVADNSLIISQATYDTDISTLKGNTSNKLCQVFKATTTNIQNIVLSMKQSGSPTGSLTMSICPLTDPTDAHSIIQYTSKVAESVGVTESSVGTSFGDVTFNFMSSALGAYGALTIGNYYAMVLASSTTVGTLYFRYNSANPYAYGFIREVTSSVTTDHDLWDLYFKIYSDNVSLAIGYGFKEGQPIIVSTGLDVVELQETTGSDNFLCIKYKGTLTDLETSPTWGTMEYSRTQDDYEIAVFNIPFTTIDASWMVLARLRHVAGLSVAVLDMAPVIPHADVLNEVYIQYELAASATATTRTLANQPYQSDFSALIDAGSLADIKIYIEDDEVTSKGIGTSAPASGTVNIDPTTKTLTFNSADVDTTTKIYADYYASLTAYRNSFTVQDFEVLGNAIFNGNVKLVGNISFDQTAIDSSSDTENDEYTGSETNLKEDLDRIKREIKKIKGLAVSATWRDTASSALTQSDYDITNYIGDGIVRDVKDAALNKLDYAVTTGYSFTVDTGKAVINRVISKYESATTLTPTAPAVGIGFTQVASEVANFPTNNDREKVTLANAHKILTISNVLSDTIKYGVDGCTFSGTPGSGDVVITKANHHFKQGDYITITNTLNYDTTTPIAITDVTIDTMSVGTYTSTNTAANNNDGYVLLDTNGGATTELAVDLYGSAKILRIITGSTQQNNTYAYTYALPRYDIVEMGNDGVISLVQGTPAASPIVPSVTDINHQKLYDLYIEEMLDNVAGNAYTAYMSGVHDGRLNTIANAFTDKRTWLLKPFEYQATTNLDLILSAQPHYDQRIKRLYRYKNDARISRIDAIDPLRGDMHCEFIYIDDIGGAGTYKVGTFLYCFSEGKVYIKSQAYNQTYYYIANENHLSMLATQAKGFILTSEDGTHYEIKVSSSNVLTTAAHASDSGVTLVDHDLNLQIFGNGALTQEYSGTSIHKIFGTEDGTIRATTLNADYITDGYTSTSLNSLNYIRVTNWKLGIVYRGELGTLYRIRVTNAGTLYTDAV